MGGGGGPSAPEVPQLRVPSVGELANEAISANIENLPRLLAAYKQYGPQYAQSVNDIFKQSQSRLQELYPEQYRVLDPLSRNIGANLDFVGRAGQSNIPDPIRMAFENNMRSSQAARGVAQSPASAYSEAIGLAGVGEQFRQGVTDEALRFIQTPTLTAPGSMVDMNSLGLDPISNTTLFGGAYNLSEDRNQAMMDQYDMNLQNFSLEQQAYNNKRKRFMDIGGLVGGAAGFAVGGPTGAAVGSQLGKAGGTFF